MASLPAQQQAAPPPVDFARQIAPLLVERCIECHGPKQQKGDLRLDQRQHVMPPDDPTSWSILPGRPEASELIRRLGLPKHDEELMPGKGEPLRPEQQQLLRRWVAEGAAWPTAGDAAIAALLVAQEVPRQVFVLPAITAAAAAELQAAAASLRQRGAIVQQVAKDTEALAVNLAVLRSAATDAELALLLPLAPRLVWLDLSGTAVSEQGLQVLGKLVELQKLVASNLPGVDGGLLPLQQLPRLQTLNACASGLSDATLLALAASNSLQQVYCWQSPVSLAGAEAAQLRRPGLLVDRGDYVAARLAQAQRQIEADAVKKHPSNTNCPVREQPVDPAILLEYEGRLIAFCCNQCKASFQAEPARYAAKLPKAEPPQAKRP